MRDESKPITRLILQVFFAADSTETGIITGDALPFPVPFGGMADLIGELDRICDYLEFPQVWEVRRRFGVRTAGAESARAEIRDRWEQKQANMPGTSSARGSQLTVHIYCRQHVSLQGLLQYRKDRIAFRSALELQGLIADIMELTHEKQARGAAEKCPLRA